MPRANHSNTVSGRLAAIPFCPEGGYTPTRLYHSDPGAMLSWCHQCGTLRWCTTLGSYQSAWRCPEGHIPTDPPEYQVGRNAAVPGLNEREEA